MRYTAHQIALWPRLIHAAAIDSILQDALLDLMERGASLTTAQDGAFRLEPGAMTPEAYAEVREAKLKPRAEKMKTILNRARTNPHPWTTPLQQAYLDLDQRVEKGVKAFTRAGQAKQDAQQIILTLLDRHLQAVSLAGVLMIAGYPAYLSHNSRHQAAWMDLYQVTQAARIDYQPAGVSWPVNTPDGWFWVIDTPQGVPEAVNLSGEIGLKEPQEGEPVVIDWDLGRALAAIEGAAMREVG